jgi:hypothetical protein
MFTRKNRPVQQLIKLYADNKKDSPIRCEIILQTYLILQGVRDIAQVFFTITDINQIKSFLEKLPILYKLELKNKTRLILYKSEHAIANLNETYGKTYAEQLGSFYTCASENWKKHSTRIVIQAFDSTSGIESIELYAQMCTDTMIEEHISVFLKLKNTLQTAFLKFNKNIEVQICIYNTNVTHWAIFDFLF